MTMVGFKNKLGLSLDSVPKTHKKYLGEADDPHFIPDSPIIDRQVFTEQEEGELKRVCALALARIPHSDDMSDDPFQYIASQVHHEPTPAPAAPVATALPKTAQPKQVPSARPPFVPDPVDSATPSESSKRDTFDRTDYSTPLTSAGITPGEPTKRFSDAVRRPSTSKGSSNLKYESSEKSKSRATSSSRGPKSTDAGARKTHDRKPSKGTNSTKPKTIKLVQQTPRASEVHAQSAEIVRPVRFSQLELNKKLPPLPRSATDPEDKVSVNRLIKTIKKKKSQVIEGQSVSASEASSPMPTAISKFNNSSTRPLSQAPPAQPTSAELKQRKFKFAKFFGGRKETSPAVMVI